MCTECLTSANVERFRINIFTVRSMYVIINTYKWLIYKFKCNPIQPRWVLKTEYRSELFTIRTLINPGPQRTFLTERNKSWLKLPYRTSRFEIVGISGQNQSTNKECEFVLYARRNNLKTQQPRCQIMAPLPREICTLSPPFQVRSIDFAGPFKITISTSRNSTTTKAYFSVFDCFGTKAIHLELCSDLSSSTFQAAFSSFVGRRELPQSEVNDNGCNFLGASRALEREFNVFVEKAAQDMARKYITCS